MKTDPASPTPPRRPRGRPRSFDRDAALDAAMEVFWSKGFETASLHDLTRAMGINPPSLYATFGDKEGLFLEAVKRYETRLGESCPYCDEPTARASVEKLLRDMASQFTEPGHPRGCLMVMASTTSNASSKRMQAAIAERRAAARARMKTRVAQGICDGELPPGTDVTALANFYMAVIAGMALQSRDGASRKALLSMVETAMRAWPSGGGSPAAKRRKPNRKASAVRA